MLAASILVEEQEIASAARVVLVTVYDVIPVSVVGRLEEETAWWIMWQAVASLQAHS